MVQLKIKFYADYMQRFRKRCSEAEVEIPSLYQTRAQRNCPFLLWSRHISFWRPQEHLQQQLCRALAAYAQGSKKSGFVIEKQPWAT